MRFAADRDGLGGNTNVFATVEGGGQTEVLLFSFFDDELSFSTQELVGRTPEEARELRYRKDVEYLRS